MKNKNGDRGVGNGKWKMKNGGRKMGDGKWEN